MIRPLESITRGRISRRTIDRQLYYFIPAGTPALVHDTKAKGSQLPTAEGGTKSRWMVAVKMFQEQPIFWCPRTKMETKSKSYTAFKTRRGIHYSQIIGLPQFPTTRRQRPLPGDFSERITIVLPDQTPMDSLTEHPEGVPIQSMKQAPSDLDISYSFTTSSRVGGVGEHCGPKRESDQVRRRDRGAHHERENHQTEETNNNQTISTTNCQTWKYNRMLGRPIFRATTHRTMGHARSHQS